MTSHQDDDADRLGNKPSSTPLMFGGTTGVVRILVLAAIALFLLYGADGAKRRTRAEDPIFDGRQFPAEIRINGQHHHALGGGAAPFGALGVYVKMTPGSVRSPPQSEWAELDRFAVDKQLFHELQAKQLEHGEDIAFFDVLAASPVGKSLVLQFDGKTTVGNLLTDHLFPEEAGEPSDLAMSLGVHAARLVQAAVSEVLQDPKVTNPSASSQHQRLPPAGSQLYVTCDQSQTHLAYSAPTQAKTAPNTAPVTKTLKDTELAAANRARGDDEGPISLCHALFAAFLVGPDTAIAQGAREGVANGFVEKFGRSHGDEL
jgi:hypothetical protein